MVPDYWREIPFRTRTRVDFYAREKSAACSRRSLLLGCGLRRSEVVGLRVDAIQRREDHWATVDLVGNGGRVRTVPIPAWVKTAIEANS
jgi:integrase